MKPREFWIYDYDISVTRQCPTLSVYAEKQNYNSNFPPTEYHVIEKSAYDELMTKAMEQFDLIVKQLNELDQLKEQCEKLASVIKSVNFTCHWYAINHKGPEHEVHHALKVELAHETDEALAEIETMKGKLG